MSDSVLVFDSELESRSHLCSALRQALLCSYQTASSAHEALRALRKMDQASVVIAPADLPAAELAGFVEDARAYGARDAVFIGILRAADSPQENLAELMIIGLHSFICEPYSIDSLQQALDLGSRVRKQGSKARLRAAAGMLLNDLVLSTVAENHQPESLDLWEQIQATSKHFKQVTGASLTTPVVRTLQNLPPRERARRCSELPTVLRSILSRALGDES